MPADVTAHSSCAWCGAPFASNRLGRPRRYCSVACRNDAGHHREAAPAFRAELAELEDAARQYERLRMPFPAEFARRREFLEGRMAD